jgi:hypothetical protein
MSGPVQQPRAYSQPWHNQPAPQQSYPPPPAVSVFQVSTTTHTGALVFWFNQRRTVTGTYEQCEAALRSAQTHCLVLGWWSFLSILIMNWIALSSNSSARKKLAADAQQAQAYAHWWHTYIGQRPPAV